MSIGGIGGAMPFTNALNAIPYDPSNGGQNATNFAPGGYYNRQGAYPVPGAAPTVPVPGQTGVIGGGGMGGAFAPPVSVPRPMPMPFQPPMPPGTPRPMPFPTPNMGPNFGGFAPGPGGVAGPVGGVGRELPAMMPQPGMGGARPNMRPVMQGRPWWQRPGGWPTQQQQHAQWLRSLLQQAGG